VQGVRNRKAGLSGLFCSGLLAFALTVATTISTYAAPLVLRVENVSVAADARTHQMLLDIVIRPADRRALDSYWGQHMGRKFSLSVDGKTMITSVVRKPVVNGMIEITDAPADDMRAVLSRLSTGSAKIELDILPN
jgi:hypothetical protein